MKHLNQIKLTFVKNLMDWFDPEARKMPWKNTTDPYKIWLSEIILQQTRVDQGTPYYLKFVKAFPTVIDLANASQDEVLKLWEGLGYYSRARNLHSAANMIVNDFKGVFPSKYEDILQLKGVGSYTAAAIASFAFKEPYAVVDGNVLRVLSRYFNIKEAIDSTSGRKIFDLLANELIDKLNPDIYNQAIMDFGATVCKPVNPLCESCPMHKTCLAKQMNKIGELPFKAKKIKKRTRHFHFYIIFDDQEIIIQKRDKKDIWKGLFQFPMIEGESNPSKLEELLQEEVILYPNEFVIGKVEKVYKQILTHQVINANFYHLKVDRIVAKSETFKVVNKYKLINFAFPKLINNFLTENPKYSLT